MGEKRFQMIWGMGKREQRQTGISPGRGFQPKGFTTHLGAGAAAGWGPWGEPVGPLQSPTATFHHRSWGVDSASGSAGRTLPSHPPAWGPGPPCVGPLEVGEGVPPIDLKGEGRRKI